MMSPSASTAKTGSAPNLKSSAAFGWYQHNTCRVSEICGASARLLNLQIAGLQKSVDLVREGLHLVGEAGA